MTEQLTPEAVSLLTRDEVESKFLQTQLALVNCERRYTYLSNKRDEVAEIIEGLITDGTIASTDTINRLCELLDITIYRESEITFTAEITGIVSIPYGKEITSYDIDVTDVSVDGENLDLNEVNITRIYVDYR
jgi:hypothetical protein